MTGRLTWRLLPEQLCDLDLLAAGYLDSIALEVGMEVDPRGDLALLDPEGVELATLRDVEVTRTPTGATAVRGTVTVQQRPEHDDFPELYLSADEVEARWAFGAGERLAVLASGPPTRELEDALLARTTQGGVSVAVLVAVGAAIGDGTFATVRAWQTALTRLPGTTLALVATADLEPARRLPLAVHAAASAGCTAVALAGDPDAVADLARHRGLDVVALPPDVVPAGTDRSAYRPDVWEQLAPAHRPPSEQGVTLLFTGLSGAGKSTIARAVAARLRGLSPRRVTLLDGDVVRHHLSSGLGFSRADRETNVLRIGWVAAEISRHGGFAVCAPIAPYDAIRKTVRRMVSEHAAFVLVHVATPIEECERRDRKGLYAQAREGRIPEFTGVSDPYEEPTDAEVRIDTRGLSVEESAQVVLDYLAAAGYLSPRP